MSIKKLFMFKWILILASLDADWNIYIDVFLIQFHFPRCLSCLFVVLFCFVPHMSNPYDLPSKEKEPGGIFWKNYALYSLSKMKLLPGILVAWWLWKTEQKKEKLFWYFQTGAQIIYILLIGLSNMSLSHWYLKYSHILVSCLIKTM